MGGGGGGAQTKVMSGRGVVIVSLQLRYLKHTVIVIVLDVSVWMYFYSSCKSHVWNDMLFCERTWTDESRRENNHQSNTDLN